MSGAGVHASHRTFPFDAVVGQDELKLALLLVAIDPSIGGVLVRGDKGSGKTTLARALATLLPGDAPFVELPLGATEDRVLGSIDVAAALTEGAETVRPGLLAAADGGVLFIDEVNLLADHLVDTLLDVAASGRHRLERDGLSVVQPARFVLVGTMNPEEGELRPQLLDRFGLCVAVAAPTDLPTRSAIVRRRLAFDGSGSGSGDLASETSGDGELRARLGETRPATIDDSVIEFASALAVEAGAEGLRADIVLCRAAAAFAGWDGRRATTIDDVQRIAPLVLAHRRRRDPFDPPTMPDDEMAAAIDRATTATGSRPVELGDERAVDLSSTAGATPHPRADGSQRPPALGRRDRAGGDRGRMIRDVPLTATDGRNVAVAPTVREFVQRRSTDVTATIGGGDLRGAVHERKAGALIVVALDTSGSMGVRERIQAATGAVLGVLTDVYRRRDRVAVVTFGGDGANVALSPTGSVEVARARLADLTTGGATPLADGIDTARDVCRRTQLATGGERRPILVLVTDGRATGSPTAADEALEAARTVARERIDAVVFDAETGTIRLGLAARLAHEMHAECRSLVALSAERFSL